MWGYSECPVAISGEIHGGAAGASEAQAGVQGDR